MTVRSRSISTRSLIEARIPKNQIRFYLTKSPAWRIMFSVMDSVRRAMLMPPGGRLIDPLPGFTGEANERVLMYRLLGCGDSARRPDSPHRQPFFMRIIADTQIFRKKIAGLRGLQDSRDFDFSKRNKIPVIIKSLKSRYLCFFFFSFFFFTPTRARASLR